MITSDIFIRCIITGVTVTKKHKEPNSPAREWALPANLGPLMCGVLQWAPEVGDLSKNQLWWVPVFPWAGSRKSSTSCPGATLNPQAKVAFTPPCVLHVRGWCRETLGARGRHWWAGRCLGKNSTWDSCREAAKGSWREAAVVGNAEGQWSGNVQKGQKKWWKVWEEISEG